MLSQEAHSKIVDPLPNSSRIPDTWRERADFGHVRGCGERASQAGARGSATTATYARQDVAMARVYWWTLLAMGSVFGLALLTDNLGWQSGTSRSLFSVLGVSVVSATATWERRRKAVSRAAAAMSARNSLH